MDIRQLTYFVEVAKYKSFTKAGQSLHVTQPTISKMVKNLEDELGVTLIDRSAKHVQLTDAGEIVLAQGQQIVKSLQNLTTELEDVLNIRKGNLRIGLPPMVGAQFFPKLLAQFHALYPDITLQLIEEGAKRVELAVEDGSMDLGVVVLPVKKENIFEYFPFVRDELRLLVHPDHVLAKRDSVHLRDLKEQPFILFREDFTLHDRILEECERSGYQPQIVCESSQWDFIREMVAANLGVALLPNIICEGLDPNHIRTVPIAKASSIPWNLAVIWRKDKYLSYAAREWVTFTSEKLQRKNM